MAAYRADIAERGTWGGGAEASVVATAFNFRTRLIILDSQRRYVVVDTIGAGPLSPRSLLNVGVHYKVVSNAAVHGQPYNAGHVLYNAPGDGDCLFWALHNVAANGAATVMDVNAAPAPPALAPLTNAAFITRARQIVSPGLSQAQIENTIIELRVTGGRGGLGPQLSRRMNLHGFAKSDIRSRLSRTGKGDSELYGYVVAKLQKAKLARAFEKQDTLAKLLDCYDRSRELLLKSPAQQPTEEEAAARERQTKALSGLSDALLGAAAENMPSTEIGSRAQRRSVTGGRAGIAQGECGADEADRIGPDAIPVQKFSVHRQAGQSRMCNGPDRAARAAIRRSRHFQVQ